jgi:hypothetical protein
MARRISYTGQIPYMTARLTVHGYRPTDSSRFAVVRVNADAPWSLIHTRSGMPVNSLLPALARKVTLADKLAVAAAFEAQTHLDWAAFDDLQELGPGFNGTQYMGPAKGAALASALRQIAAQVLA